MRTKEGLIALLFEDMVKLSRKIIRQSSQVDPSVHRERAKSLLGLEEDV